MAMMERAAIETEFGTSRALAFAGSSLPTLSMGLMPPLAGLLFDADRSYSAPVPFLSDAGDAEMTDMMIKEEIA